MTELKVTYRQFDSLDYGSHYHFDKLQMYQKKTGNKKYNSKHCISVLDI